MIFDFLQQQNSFNQPQQQIKQPGIFDEELQRTNQSLAELENLSTAQEQVKYLGDMEEDLDTKIATARTALQLSEQEAQIFDKEYYNLLTAEATSLAEKKSNMINQLIKPVARKNYLQGSNFFSTLFNVLEYGATGGMSDAYGVPTSQIINSQIEKQYEIDMQKRNQLFDSYKLVDSALKDANSSRDDYKKMVLEHVNKMIKHKIKIKEMQGEKAQQDIENMLAIEELQRKIDKDKANNEVEQSKIRLDEKKINIDKKYKSDLNNLRSLETYEKTARKRMELEAREKIRRIIEGGQDRRLDKELDTKAEESKKDRDLKLWKYNVDQAEKEKDRKIEKGKLELGKDRLGLDREIREGKLELGKDRLGLDTQKHKDKFGLDEKKFKKELKGGTGLKSQIQGERLKKLQRENIEGEKIKNYEITLGKKPYKLKAQTADIGKQLKNTKERPSIDRVDKMINIYSRMIRISSQFQGNPYALGSRFIPGTKIRREFKNLQVEARKLIGPIRIEQTGGGNVSKFEQEILNMITSFKSIEGFFGTEKTKFKSTGKDYFNAVETTIKNLFDDNDARKDYLNRLSIARKNMEKL